MKGLKKGLLAALLAGGVLVAPAASAFWGPWSWWDWWDDDDWWDYYPPPWVYAPYYGYGYYPYAYPYYAPYAYPYYGGYYPYSVPQTATPQTNTSK